MRVQIRLTGAGSGDGEGKTNQFITVERADDLPTDFAADHEHAQRHQIDIVKIPDFFLQGDTGLEFFHAVAFTDGDSIDAGHGCAHFAGSSWTLACCSNDSLSSSLSFLPVW